MEQKTNKVLLCIVILAILFAVAIIYLFFKSGGPEKADQLGPIGDYIGGLINPIFGFLSLIALLYTIKIQAEELKLTREELEATREELSRSAKAQEESSKIFQQQQFETTFFNLLEQITSQIKNFNETNRAKKSEGIYIEGYNKIISKLQYKVKNDIHLESVQEKLNSYDINISSLFLLIYQAIKLVDEAPYPKENKKKYSNIIRACLNVDILHLFAINGCRKDLDFSKYKELIENYALLEHMPFKFLGYSHSENKLLEKLAWAYDKKAFGKSEYFKNLNMKYDKI